jgi:RNA polymerase sigma factor (sigma-70 family)
MEQQGGLSDADLVRWAVSAEAPEDRKAAFEAIADRHHLAVFRQCARWFPHPEESQDVCQAAFEAAFKLLAAGKGPERADKLAGWLIEIARRRGLEYRRKDRPAGVTWAVLPGGQSLEEIEDDEEPRSGSAVRRAHATRLVETVVATLTARQQQVYQLRIVGELTGRQVAEQLGVSDKTASNEITHVQDLIANGFGALILFQEGRRYCPELAQIIETAPAAVGTAGFTTVLRERIIRHFDNCNVCDDCRTCNNKRRELVGPYVPALIPILFAADLRDRITEVIDGITRQERGTRSQPDDPGTAPPGKADAAVKTAALEDAGAGAAAVGAAALLAARPHRTEHGGTRLRRTLRRRPAVSAFVAVIALAAVGGIAAALASSGGGAPAAHAGVAAAATSGGGASGKTTAPGPLPGVITVDVTGSPLNPQVLAVAREVLTDARNHDGAALDRLLDPTTANSAQVVALNKLLAQPGVYQQIITLLTKTHGVPQDGFTGWPGFLLGSNGLPLAAADAEVLGVTNPQDYKGITVTIGDSYDAKPYVPKLSSIAQA